MELAIKKSFYFSFFIIFFFSFALHTGANGKDVKILPANVIQGEPLMAVIEGVKNISAIKKITFDDQLLGMFMYKKKPTALIGIDLRKKAGSYELMAQFSDGQAIKKNINVGAREKIEAPLGIPKKLGGDTKESQNKLVSTLAEENKILANIRTGKKAFWSEKFVYPLSNIFVTDNYGYSRKTGEYSIAHKGTDLRAKEGTPVAAMNRGVVRIARNFRNYGKVIVIDHGLGLMSFYLHLSRMNVNEGELVKRGQIMGLSGQTGYALSPHLHLSIRINNNSIDPMKFMDLFK